MGTPATQTVSHLSRVQLGCPEVLPLLAPRPVPASSLVCVPVPLACPSYALEGRQATRAVFYTFLRPDGPSFTTHPGEVSDPFDSGRELVPTDVASI